MLLYGHEWVSCGTNLDEDLHFSTSYLRMSLDKNIGNVFKGYSTFLALYDNFNEEYFLDKKECENNSKKLICKIQDDHLWFENVLNNILEKTNALFEVFDERVVTKEYLHGLDNLQLKKYYKAQNDATLELYRYARIPEVLDRGINYFTDYLMNYLRFSLNKETVYREFLALTSTNEKTLFSKADEEFYEILREIPDSIISGASMKKLNLNLCPVIMQKIYDYVDKWKFLNYHGYGNRNTMTINDVFRRIINCEKNITRSAVDRSNERDRLIDTIMIPDSILYLFNIYPKLSIIKLYRKNYQIRNFYYLDMIIAELAQRINESESFVRSMLPEEIISFLENGNTDRADIKKRIPSCVFGNLDDKEFIITDKNEIAAIKTSLKDTKKDSSTILYGYPVSKGFVIGKSKIINRKGDEESFGAGEIILSDSADPDIFETIKSAGAVLTEQGGATSHAALFCREQGIPAIVGVKNLLSIPSGTMLEVDAYSGRITIIDNINETPEAIGQKALNLRRLQTAGYNVPDFFVLNYMEIYQNYKKEHFSNIIDFSKKLETEKTYILRSSAVNEDAYDESNVGKFVSIPKVNSDNLFGKIVEFINSNNPKGYCGGIIVQEMLPFSYCGVAVTGDMRLNSINKITIEFCKGSENKITEGCGEIVRVIYDKERDEISELYNPNDIKLPETQLSYIIKAFSEIEKRWGMPVDVEWGLYMDKLYILQVRPIAGLSKSS